MRQEIKDLELCPCRSDKKYRNCCKRKNFTFVQDKDGKVYKRMPIVGDLPEYMQEAEGMSSRGEMDAEIMEIEAKLTEDTQFFDVPYLPKTESSPERLATIEIMKKANVPPELIYGFQKTGLVVTELNRHLITDVESKEFYEAVDEYLEKHKKLD